VTIYFVLKVYDVTHSRYILSSCSIYLLQSQPRVYYHANETKTIQENIQ